MRHATRPGGADASEPDIAIGEPVKEGNRLRRTSVAADHSEKTSHCECRRAVLAGALALAAAPFAPTAEANTNPRGARPQPGDRFVFMTGDRKGELIKPADIRIGHEPVLAYPVDAATSTVRDGARTNLVVLSRLDPKDIKPGTQALAAEGVVAYSAICTHYGCPITQAHTSGGKVVCNCHGSTFDVSNNGEVVVGPATRRLAVLPLKAVDGDIVVAAGFNGPLGPPQQ